MNGQPQNSVVQICRHAEHPIPSLASPERTGAALAVELLGDLQIWREGQLLPHPFPTRKTACLFAFLLLHPGRAFSREYLAGIFWYDADPGAARASLRTAVVPIRKLLEPRPEDRGRYLDATYTTLCVTPPPGCWVDLWEVERRLDEARAHPPESTEWFHALETAAGLYGGDLLPDLDEMRCLALREGLQQRLLTALHGLARADQNRKQYDRAIGWARRALAVDPCDEESHRRLMLLHALLGERSQVVRQYHECLRVLQKELETDPDPETLSLFRQLQAQLHSEWRLPSLREGVLLASGS